NDPVSPKRQRFGGVKSKCAIASPFASLGGKSEDLLRRNPSTDELDHSPVNTDIREQLVRVDTREYTGSQDGSGAYVCEARGRFHQDSRMRESTSNIPDGREQSSPMS